MRKRSPGMPYSKLVIYGFLILTILLIRCGTGGDTNKAVQNSLNALKVLKNSPPTESTEPTTTEILKDSAEKQESEKVTPGVNEVDAPPSTVPSPGP